MLLNCAPAAGSQVYEFDLNVSKGAADSDVAYGVLRSDVATVQVEVSPNFRPRGKVVHPRKPRREGWVRDRKLVVLGRRGF